MDNEFGLSDDVADLEAVRKFVRDATEDGWETTPSTSGEPIERSATLKKNGFEILAIARELDENSRYKYQASLSGWGPDGLCISLPREYDWLTIASGIERCNGCFAQGVETYRAGFAGRYCGECLPKEKTRLERPGWTM